MTAFPTKQNIENPPLPKTATGTLSPGPMTSGNRIRLARSERALFTGRTGSGKSTLADGLIRTLRYRAAVVDSKRTWDFPGYRLVTRYDANPELRYQVFRPLDDAVNGWADMVEFLESAWRDPNPVLIYVDELTLVTTPRTAPPILFRFARQGRQRRKGLWTGTQRPSEIPSTFLTEAEHWFVFDLRAKADREKVAGFLGDAALHRPKGRYSFWYANPELPDAVHVRQNGSK